MWFVILNPKGQRLKVKVIGLKDGWRFSFLVNFLFFFILGRAVD